MKNLQVKAENAPCLSTSTAPEANTLSAVHTPTPWHVVETYQGMLTDKWKKTPFRIEGADQFSPCLILGDGALNPGVAQANAAYIVRAVNNFQPLVEALRAVLSVADRETDIFRAARAALALADSN